MSSRENLERSSGVILTGKGGGGGGGEERQDKTHLKWMYMDENMLYITNGDSRKHAVHMYIQIMYNIIQCTCTCQLYDILL